MARSRLLIALATATCIATSCTTSSSAHRSGPTRDPSPSASPTLPPGSHELPTAEGATLPPGRYTKADFHPQLSFAVGRGWHSGHDVAGFFDVQQRQNTLDVIAVQFALVFSGSTATAAIHQLQQTGDLRVTDRGETTLGGRPAREVQIDSRNPRLRPQRFTAIFSVAAGSLYIGSGRRLLVDFIKTPGALVAVLVGGSVRNWPATMRATEPVVRSIRFR